MEKLITDLRKWTDAIEHRYQAGKHREALDAIAELQIIFDKMVNWYANEWEIDWFDLI